MITKITQDNYNDYQRLFAEINKKLSYVEDKEIIKDIGDYFLALDDIRDHVLETKSDYHWLILPIDESLFEINANTRAINIPTDFIRNGVAVQGDELAEVIYFSIDRYFDTTDLFEKDILIQYELPDGQPGLVVPLNKTIDFIKDKVVFGWAIDNTITQQAGNVKFSIRFYERGTGEDGSPILQFSFGTLTSTIKINSSLKIDIEDEKEIISILTDKTQQYYDYMRSSNKDSADVIPATPIFTDITPNVGIISVGTTIKGRALFTKEAMEDNKKSMGELSYYFAYTGKNEGLNEKMTATAEYMAANVDNYNSYDTYWIAEEGLKPYIKYYYNADTWEEDKNKLYHQLATLTAEKPGTYQLVAVNTTGRGASKMETEAITDAWVIPFAKDVIIKIAEHIQINDDTGLAVLAPAYTQKDNGTLTYSWYRDKELIPDATNKTYSAANEGIYRVVVTNTFNGDTTETSSNDIIVSLSPLTPEITEYFAGVNSVNMNTSNIFYYPTITAIGVSIRNFDGLRSDKITYQWYKVVPNGKEKIEGAESATLELSGTGVYFVEITNTYKTFENTISSKQFIIQPAN